MALFAKFWDRIAPLSKDVGPSKDVRADTARSAQMDDYIAGKVSARGPGFSLAIVKSGAIAHAAGYGLADVRRGVAAAPDTIFHLASSGKQLTGLGIMMLAEAGKLKVDDPVSQHLPWLSRFSPKVTLRQLLQHTSCIRDFYDETGVEEVMARSERPTNADIIRTYVDLGCPMARRGLQPGDECAYSNSGYELLGSVIERVSGQSYHDFFQTRVFDPLGMTDSFSVPDRRVGDRRCARGYVLDDNDNIVEAEGSAFDSLIGSGSFYTTILDLYRYDQALASNKLVSATSMEQALTSGRTNNGELTTYGFGWYVGTYEGMRFADHKGEWAGNYSYICRYLDQPLSIYLLSNHPAVDLVDVTNIATKVYR
jgi:CubicO group peptidase (beta-lactamase class C family)